MIQWVYLLSLITSIHSLIHLGSLTKHIQREEGLWVRLTTCLPDFSAHRWDIPVHLPGTLEWGGLVGEWLQASHPARVGCLWSPGLPPARWCRPQDCTHTGAGAEEKQSQVDKCSKLPCTWNSRRNSNCWASLISASTFAHLRVAGCQRPTLSRRLGAPADADHICLWGHLRSIATWPWCLWETWEYQILVFTLH